MNIQVAFFWWGLAIIVLAAGVVGAFWLVGSLIASTVERNSLKNKLRECEFERRNLEYVIRGVPPLPKPDPTNTEEVKV